MWAYFVHDHRVIFIIDFIRTLNPLNIPIALDLVTTSAVLRTIRDKYKGSGFHRDRMGLHLCPSNAEQTSVWKSKTLGAKSHVQKLLHCHHCPRIRLHRVSPSLKRINTNSHQNILNSSKFSPLLNDFLALVCVWLNIQGST